MNLVLFVLNAAFYIVLQQPYHSGHMRNSLFFRPYIVPCKSFQNDTPLRRLGLLRLLSPKLLLRVGLDGKLGASDSAHALDGSLAEIDTVTPLGSESGGRLVSPVTEIELAFVLL